MADDPILLDALMIAATGHAAQGADSAADLWPGFLQRLAQTMQADGIALLSEPAEGAARLWALGDAPSLPDHADMARMRMDRVYSQIDLPGSAPRPDPLRALRCPLPGGGYMLILATRHGSDFRAIDAVRLSDLGRMIARALAMWQALQAERARAELDRRARQALAVAWVVLTPAGRVLAAPPDLNGPTFTATGLRLRGDGWLDFADAALAHAVQAAMTTAMTSGQTCQVRGGLSDPPCRLSVQPADHLGSPALILWLRWQRTLAGRDADYVARSFHLSRSEARLAVRIADGQSLTDAAADLGWTVETTRSCSKQIYARLGVAGQTQVALTLHFSALWLAAPSQAN